MTDKVMETAAKYKVNGSFNNKGKCVLILGAAGNWGGHMAIGMALTSDCDLVLVETEGHRELLEAVIADLECSEAKGKIETYYVSHTPGEKIDKAALRRKLEEKYGKFDAVMELEGINRY